MRQVPECFERRYHAMDALVKDLSSETNQSNETGDPDAKDDYGFRLMCKFWNILKEDPVCDFQNVIQQRKEKGNSGTFGSQKISCYPVGNKDSKESCGSCAKKTVSIESKASGTSCCDKKPKPETPPPGTCCSKVEPVTPLCCALENMKRAATTEKQCYEKATELLNVQEKLKVQIAQLEQRELAEIMLLKEADEIWKTMEDEFKQKLEQSKRKQEELLRELTEVEVSASKWKKNKKNLEEQMSSIDKCIREIKDTCRKKTNDIKTIKAETADLEKKLAKNSNDIMTSSETLEAKRKCHDDCMKKLSEESKQLQNVTKKEEKLKKEKIEKGEQCVKEAREELALVCRVLLKKKLENEDLRAEAKALVEEIDLLKTTCDKCAEKCKNKEQSLKSEIENCECDVKKFQLKCTKCHVSCDTDNLRKYCTDCPRCKEEMESCDYSGNKCDGPAKPCICVHIKTQFMNNVFDNMQTVLERQINTRPGKVVAAQVLQCLKNSTNGKLDCATRKKLQEFILATVKTNLNLTIIGGAVKTRCEMDPDTYKDLMKCMNLVKTKKPEKADKGTDARKEPCARWGGPNECNCPKGPKNCICMKKAPKPASDPEPCGQLEEDKKDIGQLDVCPHRDNTPCGPLCGNAPKSDVAKTVAKSYKPKPCCGEKCSFNSNMRAAQCTLGDDCIEDKVTGTKGYKTKTPIIPVQSDMGQMPCDCSTVYNTCHCREITDRNIHKKWEFQQEILLPCEAELKKMFYHNDTILPVTVLGQNGISADFNAELIETYSGHMTLDVRRLSDYGEIASPVTEYPVSLYKTSSSFKLTIIQNNKHANAVLKRGYAGELNVVLKDVHVCSGKNFERLKPEEKLFHVTVKNKEGKYSKNTLLRATASGNYEFILEKEYEKLQKEIVKDFLGDINECPTTLSRTISGTFVIDFDEDSNCNPNCHKALLKKTDSGSVKLLVNVPDIKICKKHKLSTNINRTLFERLYEKLLTFSEGLDKESPKQKDLDRNLECGLKLDTTIRINIRDQSHFVAELFVCLNKMSPGQYFVIFENKTEELFIGNLLTTWLGRLPIEKSTAKELTVYLNQAGEVKNQYGWLKMSSNGKILVLVDKPSESIQTDYAGREKGMTTTSHLNTDS